MTLSSKRRPIICILALAVFAGLTQLVYAGESIWSLSYDGPKWESNFDKALERAASENKPILAFFSGSDWCPPCKKADAKIFSEPQFQAYAEQNVVLMNVDFPKASRQTRELEDQNEALVDRYAVKGFPTVVLIDSANGQALSKFGACGFMGLICSQDRIIKKIKATSDK